MQWIRIFALFFMRLNLLTMSFLTSCTLPYSEIFVSIPLGRHLQYHIFRGNLCLLYTCFEMADMTKNGLSSETIPLISNTPL